MINFIRQSTDLTGMGIRMTFQGALILLISLTLGFTANYFRADGLEIPGDWSPEARLTIESGENIAVSLEEARRLFDSDKAVFIDARMEAEYLEGHIRGAQNLPSAEFDNFFEKIIPNLPEEKTIIAYCDGVACSSSKEIAVNLIELGFPNVRVLVNGWTVWHESGLPVENETI